MINLFSNNKWLIYVVGWIIITAFQLTFLVVVLNWETPRALADSLVYNSVFALLGIGVWFTVRYQGFGPHSTSYQVVILLLGAIITVGLWLVSSRFILELLLNDQGPMTLRQWGTRLPQGFFLYILLVIIFYLVISVIQLNDKIQRESQLTSMLREAEMNVLRSQIKPHFLFNSLNSISALTLSNPNLAQEMVIKLSEFMRYSINLPETAMSTLEKELHHCNLYLEIEKVRFNDRMVVENECDVKCSGWQMPTMILQPLIENAVKHGVYEADDKVVIRLKSSCDGSYLYMTLINSYDSDMPSRKGTGTGLTNIKSRLAAVYNRYDLLTIRKENNLFEVQLRIPAKT